MAVTHIKQNKTSLFGSNCRYQPTCSQYMIDAINEWRPVKGKWLGLKRIGKCHSRAGNGLDPLPKKIKM